MRTALFIAGLFTLSACSEFTGPEQYALPSVSISGTTYEVFQLVRSTDPNYDDPRYDPHATVAVYVTVSPGNVIYCGVSAAHCAALIRRFNDGEATLIEGTPRREGM